MQRPEQHGFPFRLALIFVLLSVGIAIAGFLYYEKQRDAIERQRHEDLGAIADLKATEIEAWRRERLADAQSLLEDPAAQILARVIAEASPKLEQDALRWMSAHQKRRGYADMVLIDSSGRVRLSSQPANRGVNPDLATLALSADAPTLSDFFRNGAHAARIALCAPMAAAGRPGASGGLLIEIDPSQSIYPLIRRWPASSRTAEMLLVRRGDGEVLLPLDKADRVAATPLTGGIQEATDYRGVPVVAASRPIAGSPWILVAKIDREEIYGSLRQSALSTGLLGVGLFIAAAAGTLLLWREQQDRFYRGQRSAAREQQALRARLDYLSRNANDIILLAGHDGRILDANDSALKAYGYGREEFLRRNMMELVAPGERAGFERQWMHVMEEGGAFFETTHRRQDLSTFAVETSCSVAAIEGDMCFQSIIRDVSERKAAQERLRLLESAMLQTSDGVVIVEACGEFPCRPNPIFVNAAFERLTGYNAQDLRRQPNLLLRDPGCSPELFEHPCGEAANCPAHLETAARRKDGSEFSAEWNIMPLVDNSGRPTHCVWTCRDVTEHRRAEESLWFMSSIVESSGDAIIGKDMDGCILSWNKGAERIYGYSAEEMIGKTISILLPANRDSEFPRIMESLRQGGRIEHFETERVRKNGQSIFVSLTVSPIRDRENRLIGASAIARDITGRKRAEEEIRTLNQELEQRVVERTARLQEANRELEAFAYSVSHDLRAPLRAVDGFSRILLEEYGPLLPREAQHYLEVARRNALQMGELIDGLLKFSRLSRQPLCKQQVHPADLVREVWEELRAEQKNRRVEISVGALAPCEADALLLKQVFVNLLSNALKYTRTREVATIEVGCGGENTPVYFVRDNGVGFDSRYRDKLFGVFQRLHRAEDYEGTGVGLATVQRIVQRHGGRIWADAVLDQGATFYFTLSDAEDASGRYETHAG